MNVVIYARFSCHSQTEQSIEGQLKVCYEYAKNNNYIVVGEYIDRAQSARTDHRPEFQRMINDSDKHTFEGVLVYQLDRFARNRFDSAINKAKLKKNGVRVLSAKENITDDASGILVEGVLESMAEYYSAELSQKILRGMKINAEKCLSNGSQVGLGYKVGPDRKYYVDKEEAKIVREIFERFANGEKKQQIVDDLNNRQIKTALGRKFCINSFSKMLSNKRYIGIYTYKGTETPGGMPRIISDDLFERVQNRLKSDKITKGIHEVKEDYILTSKLFCGNCNELMTGYSGTSKSDQKYYYYICKNTKKHKCSKKIVPKKEIEELVVNECLKLLNKDSINHIVKEILKQCNELNESLSIKELKRKINETNLAIENLWKALETGQMVSAISSRIERKESELKQLETQLAIEKSKNIILSEDQIRAFINYVMTIEINDIKKQKALINIFVNSVHLYDDYCIIILNMSNIMLNKENIPLNQLKLDLKEKNNAKCSTVINDGPPLKKINTLKIEFYRI